MFDVVVAGRCGETGLLPHLRPRADPAVAVVDLTRLTSCEPLGLVAVAAFAEHAARSAGVVLAAPHDASVARYLARMRLGRVLGDLGVRHDLPEVREHPHDDVLLELTRFEGSRGADELAGIVHRAVQDVDPEAAGALHDGIVEVGDNVPRHAGSPCGFVAAQKTAGGRDLRFAVADAGVGVLATLRGAGARDDREALGLAVTEGVARAGAGAGPAGRGRGVGLSGVVAHLGALDGHLHLVSGGAWLTVGGAGPRASGGGAWPAAGAWQAAGAWPAGTAVQGLVRRGRG